MAFGPFGPTVYSVARTLSEGRPTTPFGVAIDALVPGAKSIVAWREPELSVITVPRAICGAAAFDAIAFTRPSKPMRTTSSIVFCPEANVATVRSAPMNPALT
jgi:hypothetical protein